MTNARVTLLTPPGRAAVATISLVGEDAVALAASRFRSGSGRPLDQWPAGRISFGRWQHSTEAVAQEEEVVVVRWGTTRVEVHCHGGDAACSSLVQTLLAEGAQLGDPQDWIRAQSSDPLEAEALVHLTIAETERTTAILMDQFRGALRRELAAIVECLSREEKAQARRRLEQLRQRFELGRHLTSPWRVVVAGPPNAGKSSLVNALLGYRRTLVDARPGTTRDCVAVPTVVDGWPLELVDTAGLRTAAGATEAQGVALARSAAAHADLVLWVEDLQQPSRADLDPATSRREIVRVGNKSDLVTQGLDHGTAEVLTSAHTGAGLHDLKHTLVARLVGRPPPPGAAVPFANGHARPIESALSALASDDCRAAAKALQSALTTRDC